MRKVTQYFIDLLQTLKEIENHLKQLSSCVADNPRGHGWRKYLSTGHWNDK